MSVGVGSRRVILSYFLSQSREPNSQMWGATIDSRRLRGSYGCVTYLLKFHVVARARSVRNRRYSVCSPRRNFLDARERHTREADAESILAIRKRSKCGARKRDGTDILISVCQVDRMT